MKNKNDELLKKLRATFRVEADTHLQMMAAGLLALEKTSVAEQPALVETIFRAAHSLKGAARAVNLTHVEAVCRSLENVFSAAKDKRLVISSELIDLLLQATNALEGASPPWTTARPADENLWWPHSFGSSTTR